MASGRLQPEHLTLEAVEIDGLGEVPARPTFQRGRLQLTVVVRRDHVDLLVRELGRDRSEQVEPAHPRHVDVREHHHDVGGLAGTQLPQRLLPARGEDELEEPLPDLPAELLGEQKRGCKYSKY